MKFSVRRGKACLVEWVIEGGVVSPEELPTIVEDFREVVSGVDRSTPIILSGRAPHWFYGALISELVLSDFTTIATFEPRVRLGIIVHGREDDLGCGIDLNGRVYTVELGAKGIPVISCVRFPDWDVVALEIRRDRILEPSYVRSVKEEVERYATGKPMVVYGLMPIWLGQAVVSSLCTRAPYVAFFDPRLAGAVVVSSVGGPEIGTILPLTEGDIAKIRESLRAQPTETKVVVILGAPNSGKSVFLHMLNVVLREMGYTTMTQEADLFAPTQEWSLYAPEIRRALKRYMHPEERLRWVVESLERAKRTRAVDIILADIGGGRAVDGGWEYITPENFEIMRHADLAIVCSRNDEGQIDQILEEVREKTPWIRIVAVLESVYPDEEGRHAHFDPETGVGAISYLDRDAFRENRIPEKSWEVARLVAERLKRFLTE